MPYELVPAAAKNQAITINKAVLLFGRHPDCDVVITSSRKVSRKHCCLAQVNHTFVVRDLGSMNGVRINGTAVKRSAELCPGDELIVGDVVFHLKHDSANGTTPPEKPRTPQVSQPKQTPGHMISQDIPVIIPEEEQSFSVEESIVKSRTDSEMPIELSEENIVDDDSEWEIEIIE